jgi:chromosome segregation ATPase
MDHLLPALACGLILGSAIPGLVAAASPPANKTTGIVCWSDNNGRPVGCGYTVPPEFANNPTRELNNRGVTVRKTEATLSVEALRIKQEEDTRRKVEDQERAIQRKRDDALLNSYTSEREIDARRDRDIGQLDFTILGLETYLKQVRAREADLRVRLEGFQKSGKPAPQQLTDDFNRASSEGTDTERQIVQRRSEQESLRAKYSELRQRYLELTRREPQPR